MNNSGPFDIAGMSTMYKIMSQCSAAVRKSLEGLDYFIAEGTRAFQEMQDIIQEPAMMQSQECSSQEKDTVAALLETKRYLKADYKVCLNFLNS